MRNDVTRFGTTGDDQIAQLGVVALIRIPAHANSDAFAEEGWPGDEQIPTCFDFPNRLRIIGQEHPNNAEAPIRIDQTGQIMNDLIWLLTAGISAVACLKANRIDATVHSPH